MYKTLLSILFTCVLAASVHAAEFLATNAYNVATDRTVPDEIWVVANTVKADGAFLNDLFAASGTDMSLNGTFGGNLWAAAGTTAVLSGNCDRSRL